MASNGPSNENISTEGQAESKDGANAEVNFQDLTQFMQTFFQQMQDKFQVASDQILGKNLMSQRIDELERNITELSNQAAVEEQQPPPSANQ